MESSCQCCCVKDELWWRFHCNRHAECPLTPAQMSAFALHATHSLSVFIAELLRVPCQGSIHRYAVIMMSVLDWAEVKAKGAYELTDFFKLWTRPVDETTQHSNATEWSSMPIDVCHHAFSHLHWYSDAHDGSVWQLHTAISVLALALSHWILTLMLCFMILCSWPFCKCSVNVVCPCTLSRSKGIILHHWQRLHRTFCAQRLLESLFDLPTQHLHAAPNIGC